jgi:hypothetical protein
VAGDDVALDQELGNPGRVDDVTAGQVEPAPARSPGIISAAGQQIRRQQNASPYSRRTATCSAASG